MEFGRPMDLYSSKGTKDDGRIPIEIAHTISSSMTNHIEMIVVQNFMLVIYAFKSIKSWHLTQFSNTDFWASNKKVGHNGYWFLLLIISLLNLRNWHNVFLLQKECSSTEIVILCCYNIFKNYATRITDDKLQASSFPIQCNHKNWWEKPRHYLIATNLLLHHNQITTASLYKFREYFSEMPSNTFESAFYRFVLPLI